VQTRTKQEILRGVSAVLLDKVTWDAVDATFADRFQGAGAFSCVSCIVSR
jgi:hypothetical protein